MRVGDIINNNIQEQAIIIPRLLTNNICINAEHIIGREKELKIIAEFFTQNKSTVLLNGIVGMGKTSVATKYLVENEKNYKYLAWLTVQSSLAETFTNDDVFLKALQIKDEVKKLREEKQFDTAFKVVLHHLNCLGNILIILDNANDLDDLKKYKGLFDSAQNGCRYLITSHTIPEYWTIVMIEHLPPDEAVKLYKKFATHHIYVSDDEIKNLLEKLSYHTLLIELVAKSAYTSRIAFEKLEKIISEKFIHDPTLNKRKVATGGHGDSSHDNANSETVENYIWFIFKNISCISDTEKEILKAVALLPVATTFDEDFLEAHLKFFGIKNDIFNILDELVGCGWLQLESLLEKRAYKMHPLIADVIVKKLEVSVAFADKYITHIASLINYSSLNPEHNLFENNKYKHLAERLSDLYKNENTAPVAELLGNIGNLEQEFGFYKKAAENKEHALQIAETIFEKNNATIAKYQSNLATVYRDLGHYARAAELLEIALASTLKNFGKDHPSVAVHQSNLAIVYQDFGHYARAAELLEIVLASTLKNFDGDHPIVAASQSNLANVYGDLGRYDRASELLETALVSELKFFGNGHPTIAVRQSNLAIVYRALGRYDRAAELLETALTSDLKNFGEDHPIVSKRQSNLAIVYQDLGRSDRAAELLETALASDLKNFGKDHPTLAVSQSNLANVYSELGRYNRASKLLETALTSAEKNFGKDHPNVATYQNNLASVYYKTGKKAEAKVFWQAAYENCLKNLGVAHPYTIKSKEYAEM